VLSLCLTVRAGAVPCHTCSRCGHAYPVVPTGEHGGPVGRLFPPGPWEPHVSRDVRAAALLIDPPPVLAVLEAIYGSDEFRLQGIGGDFVLPGCTQYQHLHQDFGDFLRDPSGRVDFRDLPPSEIAVNYPMEVVSAFLQPRDHSSNVAPECLR
jgi:hypothetical protein